jgi:hypothetical protein
LSSVVIVTHDAWSELAVPAVITAEAATGHIGVVVAQLRLISRQLSDAGLQLDRQHIDAHPRDGGGAGDNHMDHPRLHEMSEKAIDGCS